jgi:hypothetical protein
MVNQLKMAKVQSNRSLDERGVVTAEDGAGVGHRPSRGRRLSGRAAQAKRGLSTRDLAAFEAPNHWPDIKRPMTAKLTVCSCILQIRERQKWVATLSSKLGTKCSSRGF